MTRSYIFQSENYIWTQIESSALGNGTFGKVHKGHRKQTGEFVAVKVFKFPKNEEIKATYIEQMEAVKQLRNDYIVRYEAVEEIFNTESSKIRQILVTELADCTVRSELEKPEHYFGLPYQLLFTVIDHCAEALQYLNAKRIAHRDVKPDNVLIFKKPRLTFKLCDFGGACFLKYSNDEMTEPMGAPGYLESAIVSNTFQGRPMRGYTKDEHELWATASCFFECATGRLPFMIKDERGSFASVSLYKLLGPRPEEDVVCGERICKRLPNGEREYYNEYHSEMPLQHYSYSRSLQSILSQLFKRLFAKNKAYLRFDAFTGLCQALTSLKGRRYYNVSKLCIGEYFDTTKSRHFARRWFYEDVLDEGLPLGHTVEMMQGIKTVSDPVQFQPSDEGNLDKLVVWKYEGPGVMVNSQPDMHELMLPLNETHIRYPVDVQNAIGLLAQMQLQERQMHLFHSTLLSFCHKCKEATRILCSREPNAEQKLLEARKQFSTSQIGDNLEEEWDLLEELEGNEAMDTDATSAEPLVYDQTAVKNNVLCDRRRMNGLQWSNLRLQEVINAQEEIKELTERNELFDVNCKLIVKEYTEAQRSLAETTSLVHNAVTDFLAPEILTLHRNLKALRERQASSSKTAQWISILNEWRN